MCSAYLIWFQICCKMGFADGLAGKKYACNAGGTGDAGLIPELGGAPGEGRWQPTLYSCLKNLIDGGAWRATIQRAGRD